MAGRPAARHGVVRKGSEVSQAERKVKSLSELEDEYRQRWGTPRHVPQNLQRLFGDEWRLGLDVCAEEWSAKASRWFGPGSSLGEDCFAVGGTSRYQAEVWVDHAAGGVVFCNPQFNTIPRWVDVLRCIPEVRGGKAILWGPTRSDQGWWWELRKLARAGKSRLVEVNGRVNHECPPPLAEAYTRAGKRPFGERWPHGSVVHRSQHINATPRAFGDPS